MITNTSFNKITYRDDLSRYLINRKGNIYSLFSNKVLEPQTDRYGYYQYVLTTDDGKRVKISAHIAVAKQYIPNDDPENKTIVNHIDENKHNSSVDNLEWVTAKQNANHGTRNERISKRHGKPVNEYDLNGHYIRTWTSTRAVVRFFANFLGLSPIQQSSCESSINACVKNKQKTSMNRVWRYFDGNTEDICVEYGYMPRGIACSKSKMRFDYDVDIPDEYLYHKMSADDIYNYFIHLDKLTNYEKQMIEELKTL